MSGFNLIDLFIVVYLWLWIIYGYNRGFLIATFNLAIFMISLFLGAMAYGYLSILLDDVFDFPRSYLNLLAFLLLYAVFHFLLGLIEEWIYPPTLRVLLKAHLNKVNKVAGILPGLAVGFIWLAIILGALSWFPVSHFIKNQIDNSITGKPIVKVAEVIKPQAEQIAGKAIDDTIAFITPEGTDENWQPNIPSDEKLQFDSKAEAYMLNLVNQERSKHGLRRLMIDTRLRDVARAHSLDMVKHNYFNHKSPTTGYASDRLLAAGIIYLAVGENLAYAMDIDIAHSGLMESKGHRENILNPLYGRAGIGIVDAGPFGYMCTQNFTN